MSEPNKLTTDEIAVLQDLDRSLGKQRSELAVLVVGIEQAQAQKLGMVQKILQSEEAIRGKLADFMATRGMDTAKPWRFDFAAMAFDTEAE